MKKQFNEARQALLIKFATGANFWGKRLHDTKLTVVETIQSAQDELKNLDLEPSQLLEWLENNKPAAAKKAAASNKPAADTMQEQQSHTSLDKSKFNENGYIITSAQNNSKLCTEFLTALRAYALANDYSILIGGVKERPIAYKLGLGFCDHNHERKLALAGYKGMLNFAKEIYATAMSPVFQFTKNK